MGSVSRRTRVLINVKMFLFDLIELQHVPDLLAGYGSTMFCPNRPTWLAMCLPIDLGGPKVRHTHDPSKVFGDVVPCEKTTRWFWCAAPELLCYSSTCSSASGESPALGEEKSEAPIENMKNNDLL